MGDSTVKKPKIGIRLANNVNVDDILDAGGSADISGAAYLGEIRGINATDYAEIKLAESLSISNMENLMDMVNQVGDPYEVGIYIRDRGEGSFTVPMYVKNDVDIVDGHNLAYAMLEFPCGITGTVTSGSPGTADEAAEYDPVDDVVTNFGFGDGYGGYNILITSQYTSAGSTKYNQIFFDNCRLSPGRGFNPQQANRITVNFVARRVRIVQGADTSGLEA